jgi:hypothetical protein
MALHNPKVNTGLGIALIVGAVIVLLAVGFVLRGRLPRAVGIAIAAAAGAGIGAGALLVQDHASAADWAVVVPVIAFLAPAHVHIVLGPFGRSGPLPATAPGETANGGTEGLPAG